MIIDCSKKVIIAGLLFFSPLLNAQSFIDMTEDVKKSPAYEIPSADFNAVEARYKQSRAELLPNIDLNISTFWNNKHYDTLKDEYPPEKQHYQAHNGELSLTLPIINPVKWRAFNQAKLNIQKGYAELNSQQNDLLIKFYDDWFDYLHTQNELSFVSAQLATFKKQLEIAEKGLIVGTYGRPQYSDIQQKYEEAAVNQLNLQMDSDVKLSKLQSYLSKDIFTPNDIDYDLLAAFVANKSTIDEWYDLARKQSATIKSASINVQVAKEEKNKQDSQHAPTLDFQMNLKMNHQDVGNFPGQSGYDIQENDVGFRFKLPIFSSGLLYAKSKEAYAQQKKAELELTVAEKTVMTLVREGYSLLTIGERRYASAIRLLNSANVLLETAKKGTLLGIKSDVDQLEALQKMNSAQKELKKSAYDIIKGYIKLKMSINQFNSADIVFVDHVLGGDKK